VIERLATEPLGKVPGGKHGDETKTAIHFACRYKAPLNVIQAIVQANLDDFTEEHCHYDSAILQEVCFYPQRVSIETMEYLLRKNRSLVLAVPLQVLYWKRRIAIN
jgi:hypothetical protein